jgi:hypothetical protein
MALDGKACSQLGLNDYGDRQRNGEWLAAWVFLIFIGGIPILVDASGPAGIDTNYFVTAGKMNSLF